MSLSIYQVDAFITDKKFSGNPAGVCILPSAADEAWMKGIAMEMNLSETAFLVRQHDGFDLRWFTPTVEVALCGHATLASAHTLWETQHLGTDEQTRFHTKSGLLTAERKGKLIELNFPAKREQQATPPSDLLQALGIIPKYVGRNQFDYLMEVESEKIVHEMKPDFTMLRRIPVRGVVVTCKSSTAGYDFISRYFAPGSGIDEDPVTGSAHCCLGPYWKQRLGKNEFVAYQASPRGGVVYVRVDGKRVYLGGEAVTVLRGELML
jgi:PhzF family phenazine biosynthesis protein